MNNKHISGKANEIKGKVKEEVGHATGNNRVESEGVIDQVKGKVQQAYGDLKDAVKSGVDKALHKA